MALTGTIVADLYPPEHRGQVQGVTSSAWAISAIVGPAIGALPVSGGATALEPAVATQFRVALVAAMHDLFALALIVAGLGTVATVGMAEWQKRSLPRLTNPSPPLECRCA